MAIMKPVLTIVCADVSPPCLKVPIPAFFMAPTFELLSADIEGVIELYLTRLGREKRFVCMVDTDAEGKDRVEIVFKDKERDDILMSAGIYSVWQQGGRLNNTLQVKVNVRLTPTPLSHRQGSFYQAGGQDSTSGTGTAESFVVSVSQSVNV